MQSLGYVGFDRFNARGCKDAMAGSATECRDIYDKWLSFLRRNVFAYSLSPSTPKERRFQVNARSRRAGGFSMARFITVNGKSQLLRRTSEIGLDERDGYALYLPLRGELELSQFDRHQVYKANSPALVSASDQLIQTKLGDNDTLCLVMPREFVDQRVVSGEDLCVRSTANTEGIRHLLAVTLLAFERDAPTLGEEEFSGATRIVGELALLALSRCDGQSNLRSVRTCNLARVKRWIRAHFSNPELTLSDVARDCGLSLRYLHELFRDDGRTAREYLIGERLQHARHLLESASDCSTTVTSVAFACGFVNASHFSTAFRCAFGLSPRDVLRRRH